MRSISRRTTLAALAGVIPAAQLLPAAGKDFWNTKKPEEWSANEIEVLLSDSPWAREASMEFNAEGMGGPGGGMGGPGGGMGGPGGGMGGPGGGMGGAPGMGGPGGGMGGPGGGMGGPPGMGDMKATIRWESAAPIAAAQKIDLPTNAQTHYVISVSGIPAMRGRGPGGPDRQNAQASDDRREQMQERMQARLKEKTKLTRKGKAPINVDTVERKEENGETVYVFSFLREGQAITADDKDVTFVSALGPMEVKAKFSLKQMIYRGQLTL